MNTRMNLITKTLVAALALSAPLFAANTAARHSVYDMDATEREAYAPAVKTLLYQDTAQVAAVEGLPCGDYFAIAEAFPAPKAAVEDSGSKTAWVWAGATGAVLAAGVAAWVVLSGDEPETRSIAILP